MLSSIATKADLTVLSAAYPGYALVKARTGEMRSFGGARAIARTLESHVWAGVNHKGQF